MNNHLKYKIGIIGLGVLGSGIANHILKQKIKLYGYDISKKHIKNLDKNYRGEKLHSAINVSHKSKYSYS